MAFKKGESGNPKGRPRGSSNLPRFADMVSEDQRRNFKDWAMRNYKKNPRLAVWVGDNAFRKLKDEIDVTTDDEPLNKPTAEIVAIAEEAAKLLKKRKTKSE